MSTGSPNPRTGPSGVLIGALRRAADHAGVLPIDVERLLVVLSAGGEADHIAALRASALPLSALRMLKAELSGYIHTRNNRLTLTVEGRRATELIVAHRSSRAEFMRRAASVAEARLHEIEETRPRSLRKLDQFRALPETVIKRVMLMDDYGLLEGRRLVFVGDDDLTSVAATIMDPTVSATVIEIDPEICRVLRVALPDSDSIRVVQHDLREPLPKALLGRSEIVVTDPPYTVNGARLFLSRGIDAMRKGGGAIFLSYGYSLRARERGVAIQALLTELGLLMHAKIPNFNAYYAAGSIGATSSQYVLLTTPSTEGMSRNKYIGPIYTWETTNT